MIMKRIKFRRATMMIRGIDGDALCIDDGKMSFMDGRLSTKLGCSIMDVSCARDGQSASNPALNGSTRWIR
ncbi:hypothetical protein P692DRAFT_20838614 [Suillus brevipes Sb2]|jgi:hypothetical protein|nr:hypothetical protein P692DRAFT_20838614 [Suillus brevipes Sb2]